MPTTSCVGISPPVSVGWGRGYNQYRVIVRSTEIDTGQQSTVGSVSEQLKVTKSGRTRTVLTATWTV